MFVDGEPEKVKKTKQLLPDATYTTWGRIKTALPKAIARPVANPVIPDHNVWGKPTVGKARRQARIQGRAARLAKGFRGHTEAAARQGRVHCAPRTARSTCFSAFARSARELHAHLLAIQRVTDRQTLWLVWPKKASGVKSDLDGNVVRTTGLAAGWVDFKVCSVDDTWSGLAFKRRK